MLPSRSASRRSASARGSAERLYTFFPHSPQKRTRSSPTIALHRTLHGVPTLAFSSSMTVAYGRRGQKIHPLPSVVPPEHEEAQRERDHEPAAQRGEPREERGRAR